MIGAMIRCQALSEAGHHFNLVSVHNADENNFIKSLLMKQPWYKNESLPISDEHFPWIGLQKPNHILWNATDNITWVDMAPFRYSNWAEGEPKQKVSACLIQYFIYSCCQSIEIR